MSGRRTEGGRLPSFYGSVNTKGREEEDDGIDKSQRRSSKAQASLTTSRPFNLYFSMFITVVLSILLFGCVSMYKGIEHQRVIMEKMQIQLQALSQVQLQTTDAVDHGYKKPQQEQMHLQEHSHVKQTPRAHLHKHSLDLPTKFAIKYATPRKTQDHRGTCWDFATVGVLEQSYRSQGIEKGWLQEDEYVALSEQAYGVEVLKLCSGDFASEQQISCRVAGDSIWHNSTEGGESAELYYLVNGLKHAIFPVSVCPYTPLAGNDTVCPMTFETKTRNPLSFALEKMETYYDDSVVKQKLIEKNTAMAFTTAMPYITHYYPCIGPFKNDPRCDENSPRCVLCPPELSMSTCCVPLPGGENYNMNAEFTAHRGGMTLEGGHVMVLVGFNDNFRTKDGYTGGYILKNSWFDGTHPPLGPRVARGSHSIKYWMQEISDWEERTICPNSASPYNWYHCGNSGEVTHGHRGSSLIPLPVFNRSNAFHEGVDACLSAETKLYADLNVQPLHLKCTNDQICHTDPKYTYFARNMTDWGDRMVMLCVFEYNTVTKASDDLCLSPMLVAQLAYIFSPVEVYENDPDACGFYFFPYEVNRQYVSTFEGFYVNHFDIKWHAQSYLANAEAHPELDYSQVRMSTKKQRKYDFVGPFPFARVVV